VKIAVLGSDEEVDADVGEEEEEGEAGEVADEGELEPEVVFSGEALVLDWVRWG
jgi:hypothetical protein